MKGEGKMDTAQFEKLSKYDFGKRRKRKRFNRLNKECKTNQIVLLGDSITEFFDVCLLEGKSSLEIYNRGISGDMSNRLLERLYDNVIAIKPKQIFLLIGTNDFDKGADCDFVFGNIKKTVEIIKKELPETEIFVECIFPVNPLVFSCAPTRNEYILKQYANEGGFTLLDLNPLLSDENGNFSKEYSDDGLHPNEAGNRAIADFLAQHLI